MLIGKCAVITGSTSGIGLGIAKALAKQGCHILLNGFGEPAVIEAARAGLAKESDTRVLYHGADLSRPADVGELISMAARELGGVDILVNNAGIQHPAPIEQFPPEKWDQILAINLSASFHTIRHALPLMRRGGWGRIIQTASVHGLVASANKSAYVAAKHGLIGLTKSVALETAGSGITCNAICPGWTHTELIKPQIAARSQQLGVGIEEATRSLLIEKQPSGQFVTVDQIGQIAVFLCSDAAAQITGAAIPVDGAWTAQ
jgi:3-hydroxybutyrate dehydrogenase